MAQNIWRNNLFPLIEKILVSLTSSSHYEEVFLDRVFNMDSIQYVDFVHLAGRLVIAA